MGLYCACDWKMTPSVYIDCVNKTITTYEVDQNGCTCDWDGWISTCAYPDERKNKHVAIQKYPSKSGKYLVRYQTLCGDRYEEVDIYYEIPIKIEKDSRGHEFPIHWEKEYFEIYDGIGVLHSPYAWKEF